MTKNDTYELYEVFRVEAGIPLFLEDHIQRLFHGARKAGIRLNFDFQEIEDYLKGVLTREKTKTGNIRFSVFFDPSTREIQSYIAKRIPHQYPSAEQYEKGVCCGLFFNERENPETKIANTKLRLDANKIIKDKGCFEVLLVNHLGHITEGSRSNVFFISKDQLYTAPGDLVLPGIARKKTLEAANNLQIPVNFQSISYNKLKETDGAFITGTSPRILPINKIENINLKVPHPQIQELTREFSNIIGRYIKAAGG